MGKLTAVQKLKQYIAYQAFETRYDTPEEIDIAFEDAVGQDGVLSECRGGTHETGLPCDYSRHYESKAVAAEMLDGSWVGWTHWYGGGKHGEPCSIPWVEDAYDVEMVEVTEPVKKFTRIGGGT